MEVEVPEVPRSVPRGPLLAWIACGVWAAYWIHAEATTPPPEAFPAWLREDVPYQAWELPILLAGGILLLLFAGIALRGDLRWRFRISRSGSEAFAAAAAAWLLLELGVYVAADHGFGDTFGLTLWFLVPIATLAVGLAWPVSAGVEGRRAQVALGLTRGRGFLREAAIGLLAVPAVLAVDALWEILVRPDPGRSHPLDDWLYSGLADLRNYAILSSVLQAPLVEECGFRGILYRFFRDATRRLPAAAGIGLSILANALLFAVVHPYGWPALFPILLFGAAACLLREWRGSLVAPIALHSGFNAWLLLGDVVEGRL